MCIRDRYQRRVHGENIQTFNNQMDGGGNEEKESGRPGRGADEELMMLYKANRPSEINMVGETLNSYYCALCGALCLVIDKSLEMLPIRKTDYAIIIRYGEHFFKHYLKQAGVILIARTAGIEKQWRWNCECGVLVAYQSVPYEELQDGRKHEEFTNQPHFYILTDALVIDAKLSKLIQELSKMQR
eukprot:TRINITY_DN25219_c0_g1_i2.p1 TRINITY_DN25219_c0_g1~~TRINITY_DN25219_c0_g1_i2.p1  ORF type:complete len:186 (+),score=24.98 TRINITY_DN25219_c0_g1_i2:63-620(+)